MKIPKPNPEKIREIFKDIEKLGHRDRAFRIMEIMNFFHDYYMDKIEVILAIAGEMQKHFTEDRK